jgi:hypothetical protein
MPVIIKHINADNLSNTNCSGSWSLSKANQLPNVKVKDFPESNSVHNDKDAQNEKSTTRVAIVAESLREIRPEKYEITAPMRGVSKTRAIRASVLPAILYHLSCELSVVSTERILRNTERMMAKPIADSAAAITMTKKTAICPSRFPTTWLKVTKVRFTELSIISMHMNTTIELRLNATPTAPIMKRRNATPRYPTTALILFPP